MLIESLLVARICCGAATATSRPQEPVIVSAAWLSAHVSQPDVVTLDVVHSEDAFRLGHIPGGRFVLYDDIVTSRDGLSSELPEAKQLRQVFANAGVSDESRVIVYSNDPLMAARAFFTLEYVGQQHAAILDGGLNAWTARGGRVDTDAPIIRQGRMTARERPEIVASAEWVKSRIGSPNVIFIDTRTDGEYRGTADRHGMPSLGHVPGARQLQWQELLSDASAGVFRPEPELAAIFAGRAPRQDTVVTYCYIGYRASMTYLVARALGYTVKLYDGSYQDWARRAFPVTAGERP